MKVALFVLCLLLSFRAWTQNIRYVKAIDAGQANGSSWANATDNIQYAINSLSATGGQVWVAQGTYKPTTGTTDRTASFSIASGVQVYGGFPNTGNSSQPYRA